MNNRLRPPSATAVLLVMLAFSGCGPKMPPAADPEQAKAGLRAALDAWQQGDACESLPQRSPPIYFNDEVWRHGRPLEKYEVVSESPNGRSWLCEVKLTFCDASNAPRTFRYLVDTDPALVIVQQP